MKKVQWQNLLYLFTTLNVLTVSTGDDRFLLATPIKQGESKELDCDVKNSGMLDSWRWTHGKTHTGEKVIAELIGLLRRGENDHIKITFQPEKFGLILSNMTSSMAGFYTCHANNVSKNEYHVYMPELCTITKCTMSTGEKGIFLELSTAPDDLKMYFSSVDATIKCNGTLSYSLDILKDSTLSPPYVVLELIHAQQYRTCNVSVKYTKEPFCFLHLPEDEVSILCEPASSAGGKETPSTKVPGKSKTTSEPSTSAQEEPSTGNISSATPISSHEQETTKHSAESTTTPTNPTPTNPTPTNPTPTNPTPTNPTPTNPTPTPTPMISEKTTGPATNINNSTTKESPPCDCWKKCWIWVVIAVIAVIILIIVGIVLIVAFIYRQRNKSRSPNPDESQATSGTTADTHIQLTDISS